MKKKLAVYGAGGFGKEVRGMIELNQQKYVFTGFMDDFLQTITHLDEKYFDDVLVAIANPFARKKVVDNWSGKPVAFMSLISNDVQLHPSITIGKGSILCSGVKTTVDIHIGDFVIINLNATIGHDVKIGDYSSIMPSANISGSVKIGQNVFVGAGATILQNLSIGDGAVIGAGAVVTRSVGNAEKVRGVPARIYQ